MTPTLDDLAPLFPLGILSDDEANELRRLEAAGGDEALALTRAYRDAVVQIADSLEPVTPPAELRRRVMASVSPAAQKIVRASEGKWLDLAPGVRLKKLSSDRARNTVTVLIEMEPGSTLPAHENRHPEDSFLVRGSCRIGEVAFRPGDFHRVEAGAHHDAIVSDEGCAVLIVMDAEDYLAA
jgi:anti-sigma factor ChrR (cupin superfamily)